MRCWPAILTMTALYSSTSHWMAGPTSRSSVSIRFFSSIAFFNDATLQQLVVLILFPELSGRPWPGCLKNRFRSGHARHRQQRCHDPRTGVNTNRMKIIGPRACKRTDGNGADFSSHRFQGFADINMGIGIVILGLGSVMIGEIISKAFRVQSILFQLLAVIAGSILFRMILALALSDRHRSALPETCGCWDRPHCRFHSKPETGT
jgi:putative ABC transport system permease protein